MFSLRIYRYLLGNLTTEILKVVEKCNIYKEYHGSWWPRHLTKKITRVAGIWQILKNMLGGALGEGMLTHGIDWDMINSYIPPRHKYFV